MRLTAELRKTMPDLRLLQVGGSWQASHLELIRSLELEGAVSQVRGISRAELAGHYRRASAVLMPSRAEGFGMVYLEAMRLGRPCITGHDGGAEVVGPVAGLQVDPADTPQLTAALLSLLSLNDQWQVRSAAARTRYETMFTAQHFGARLNQALQRIS